MRNYKKQVGWSVSDTQRLAKSLKPVVVLAIPNTIIKREQSVWQRRFWEHQIRDKRDFAQHVDYIHFNPVSHGLAEATRDWHYSSFHRYMRDGSYPIDWGADGNVQFALEVGYE
ncbi:MAG: hypothetical protein DCF20_18075 [Pseudanabaena sp.]|nr:MAG: hypothetical protein DCF20_18075 [Pseudanabaena sp.]